MPIVDDYVRQQLVTMAEQSRKHGELLAAMNSKLDAIETQTTKTNGCVGELYNRSNEHAVMLERHEGLIRSTREAAKTAADKKTPPRSPAAELVGRLVKVVLVLGVVIAYLVGGQQLLAFICTTIK